MPIPTEHHGKPAAGRTPEARGDSGSLPPASRPRTVVPVVRELPADLETPVSVYLKLAGARPSFLLESITGGEQVARYSFIGVNPSQAYVLRGRTVARHGPDGVVEIILPDGQDPLDFLRGELGQYAAHTRARLAAFLRRAGGLPGV